MVNVNFKKTSYVVLSCLISFFMQSCFSDSDSQEEIDEKKIKEYVTENNINATRHDTGIYYLIKEEGTGENPVYDSEVTVKYKGYYLNGSVFDQTPSGETRTFTLNKLIPGWQICIPMLKTGGKGTFIIPSYWGYGDGQVRIFDIELVSFK